MRLLVKALFRARRELPLFLLALAMLLGVTVASQLETVTLGILSDSSVDFFKLFQSNQQPDILMQGDIAAQWTSIDPTGEGITRADAEAYLVRSGQGGLLKRLIYQVKAQLRLHEGLGRFITVLLCVTFLKALFLFFSRYTTRVLGIRVSRDLREQYFDHLQVLPMRFYQKHTIGGLASRVAHDSHQISSSINSMIVNYIHAPFRILSTLTLCFFISWRLSVVIFFGLPLVIVPIILVTRKVRAVTRQLQRNQEKFTSVLVDFLAGIETVKVFAMEMFSLNKYREQNDRMAHLESKTAKYDLLTRPILHAITMLCIAVVVLFGLHILGMGLAEVVIFIALLHQFYEPIKKFAEENANVQRGVVAAERMQEVLALVPQKSVATPHRALRYFNEAITFRNVAFRYEKEWVLRDFNLSIAKGETIALVGSTGAGKSTIVQLLPRLYEWNEGEVCIDGKSLRRYTKKSLREMIAFVPQKPFLFKDTVAANIAYGRAIARDAIIAAAKSAHAHDFIIRLANGYDTLLDEMGKNLSGGQQQRLAIARALVKKAPVLVLDEPTSALDSLSEKQIQLALQELRGKVTQILIAHRLSTVEHADRLVYLEGGRVVAQGPREELLKECPPFRKMWDTHFQAGAGVV